MITPGSRNSKKKKSRMRLPRYRESPEFKVDDAETQSRKISFIRDRIPYRDPTPRLITKVTRDSEGRLVSQTRDVNSKDQPVVAEEPVPFTEHESMVQSLIADAKAQGKSMTPEQAEAEIGRIRLKALNLGNQGKSAGLTAAADLHQLRTERQEFLKAKKDAGGKLTQAQALSLHGRAMAYGKDKLQKDYKDKLILMSQAQKDKAAMDFARQYVEGMGGEDGIMDWDELTKIINPNKPDNPYNNPFSYRPGQKPATKTGKPLSPPK